MYVDSISLYHGQFCNKHSIYIPLCTYARVSLGYIQDQNLGSLCIFNLTKKCQNVLYCFIFSQGVPESFCFSTFSLTFDVILFSTFCKFNEYKVISHCLICISLITSEVVSSFTFRGLQKRKKTKWLFKPFSYFLFGFLVSVLLIFSSYMFRY